MSPSPIQPKTEITNNLNKDLKTNRVSHSIKKTSCSSMLVPSNKPQQQRQPVIIYTHSPKIIETHPKDFKALVQKLTGLSHDNSGEKDEEANPISNCNPPPQLPPPEVAVEEAIMEVKYPKKENETSSVITEENNCGYSCMGEVKSCFMDAPSMMMEPPLMPYMRSLPVYDPNSVELMNPNMPFLNYPESFFF
ncbi:PREDICTED: VQ motif-containing protein 20-like [Lupinus angustifolius]|nr:PREDICTED: VQ motif-containing protein 20-like [Lupinus angustifolius]